MENSYRSSCSVAQATWLLGRGGGVLHLWPQPAADHRHERVLGRAEKKPRKLLPRQCKLYSNIAKYSFFISSCSFFRTRPLWRVLASMRSNVESQRMRKTSLYGWHIKCYSIIQYLSCVALFYTVESEHGAAVHPQSVSAARARGRLGSPRLGCGLDHRKQLRDRAGGPG